MTYECSHEVNLKVLQELFGETEDLELLWPKVKRPFDFEQWSGAFSSHKDNRSIIFFIEENKRIGHVALLRNQSGQLSICFVYLVPNKRGTGLAKQMLEISEKIAFETLNAKKLTLVVRDYNPKAYKLYLTSGYRETSRRDTAIYMEKDL